MRCLTAILLLTGCNRECTVMVERGTATTVWSQAVVSTSAVGDQASDVGLFDGGFYLDYAFDGGSLRLQCLHDMTKAASGRIADECAEPSCDLLSAEIDHDGYAADSVDGTIDIEDTTIETDPGGGQRGHAHVVLAIDAVLRGPSSRTLTLDGTIDLTTVPRTIHYACDGPDPLSTAKPGGG